MKRIFFLLTILLFAGALPAQTCKLSGVVLDAKTGTIITGARVSLVHTPFWLFTNLNGEFTMQGLEQGEYELVISHLIYKTAIFKIQVKAGQVYFQNFNLQPEDIDLIGKELNNDLKRNSETKFAGEQSLPLAKSEFGRINIERPSTFENTGNVRGSLISKISLYNNKEKTITINNIPIEEIGIKNEPGEKYNPDITFLFYLNNLKPSGTQFHIGVDYNTDNISAMTLQDMYAGKKVWGQYPSGYNGTRVSISGPVIPQKIWFMSVWNYSSSRGGTQYPEEAYDYGIVSNATYSDQVPLAWHAGALQKFMSQTVTSINTINIDAGSMSLRLKGAFGINRSNTGASGFYNRFDSRGNDFHFWSQLYSAKFEHKISENTSYELNFGYRYNHQVNRDQYLGEQYELYGDSVANAAAGSVWTRSARDLMLGWRGRYYYPRFLSVWNQSWPNDGYLTASFFKSNYQRFDINGILNLNLLDRHSFKLGFSYTTYSTRTWQPSIQLGWAEGFSAYLNAHPGVDPEILKANYSRFYYFGGYGYDPDGNEADDDFNGPYHPLFFSAFVKDNFTLNDMFVDLSISYNYTNYNLMKLVDPSNPQNGVTKTTNGYIINPTGWEKSSASNMFSPRIHIAMPINDNAKVFVGYGNYIQRPYLYDVYVSPLNSIRYLNRAYGIASLLQDIKPLSITSFEAGGEYNISGLLNIKAEYFVKNISNEMINQNVNTSIYALVSDYYAVVSSGSYRKNGIKLDLLVNRFHGLSINGSLTCIFNPSEKADSSASNGIVYENTSSVNDYIWQNMTPLNYSSPFLGEINISYTWKLDEGGPILSGLGLSLSMYFNRPYNPYTITAANSELDYSIPGAFNSHAATPLGPMAMSQYIQKFTADAAIEKKFLITDKLAGSIYFKVKNVFDIRNILNVYDKTGSPYDDGYLYNPAQVSTIRAVYGETWYAWRVFLLNHDNSYIGLPSTFLVGIRLEY